MKMKIFCVRDRAVDAYGNPFFARSEAEAVRSFKDEVNNAQSPFNAHPDDYDLYALGEYDPDLGAIVGNDPRMVAIGKSMINDKE